MPSLFYRSFQKLHLPLAVVIILLQRAPQLYSSLLARLSQPSIQIVQKAILTSAALAAPHAVSGATKSQYKVDEATYNLGNGDVSHPETAKVGENVAIEISNTVTAASWTLSNSLPPGLRITDTFEEVEVENGVINAGFIRLIGTPTQEGIFAFKLRPWSMVNAGGTDAPGDLVIFFTVEESDLPPPPPPTIRFTKNEDTLTLTWNSSEATAYQLVSSTALTSWTPVTQQAAESNGESSIQIPLLESEDTFFRFELLAP